MQTRGRRNTSLILWLLVIVVAVGGLYLFITSGSQKPSTSVINNENREFATPAPTSAPVAKASDSPDAKASNSPTPNEAGGGSGGGGGTSGASGPLTPTTQVYPAPQLQPATTPIPIQASTPAPTAVRPIVPAATAPPS